MATLSGFNDYIDQRGIRFSPDGKFLAVKGGTRVLVWDTRNWQAPVEQFEGEPNREETINDAVVFSPDSQTIVTRIVEGVGVRRLGSGRWGQVLTNPPPNSDQPIPQKGQSPGSGIRRSPSPDNFGRVLEFSRDGKVLAISHWSRLHLFQWPSLAEITTLVRDEVGPDHAFRVLSAAFSAEVMAVGYRDGVLRLFEVGTWKQIAEWEAHKSYAVSLAFSPDGKTLATGGSDQLIKLWDIATAVAAYSKLKQPRPVSTLLGHRGRVQALDFSPNDGRLLTSVCGEEVKL